MHHFVHNMQLQPPKLKELAGRVVRLKMSRLPIREVLPRYADDFIGFGAFFALTSPSLLADFDPISLFIDAFHHIYFSIV